MICMSNLRRIADRPPRQPAACIASSKHKPASKATRDLHQLLIKFDRNYIITFITVNISKWTDEMMEGKGEERWRQRREAAAATRQQRPHQRHHAQGRRGRQGGPRHTRPTMGCPRASSPAGHSGPHSSSTAKACWHGALRTGSSGARASVSASSHSRRSATSRHRQAPRRGRRWRRWEMKHSHVIKSTARPNQPK